MSQELYSRFQRISSALFGKTAEDLKRQLDGPIILPPGITNADLIKLEDIAMTAWRTGKVNDPRKLMAWQGQLLPEQKARWLVVQEARRVLRQRQGKIKGL